MSKSVYFKYNLSKGGAVNLYHDLIMENAGQSERRRCY